MALFPKFNPNSAKAANSAKDNEQATDFSNFSRISRGRPASAVTGHNQKALIISNTGNSPNKTAGAAIPAKNKIPIEEVKKIRTREDLMALSLHPCIWCANYTYFRGYCERYQVRLPEPTRE